MQFKKAQRKQAKLRLALSGPSGAGKTWSSLLIAKGLGGRVAVIDTERESASLYCDLCEFDILDLSPPYKPERFIEAIRAAENEGYDVIIIDSATHEWSGSGGCTEMNQILADTSFKGNTWVAWSVTTPRHRAFIDAMLHCKAHLIATFRSKTETVQEGGRVRKVGMKDEARDGTEYEFTTVLNVTHENHMASASKDRTGLFGDPHIITEDTGRKLKSWLESGAVMTAEPMVFQQMRKAKDLNELKSLFETGKVDSEVKAKWNEFLAIKDARKTELQAKQAGKDTVKTELQAEQAGKDSDSAA